MAMKLPDTKSERPEAVNSPSARRNPSGKTRNSTPLVPRPISTERCLPKITSMKK
ncbi:MAG: hypothetical protein ACLSHL_11290 [Alistipes communis]